MIDVEEVCRGFLEAAKFAMKRIVDFIFQVGSRRVRFGGRAGGTCAASSQPGWGPGNECWAFG
jgi:hypothetical protein